MDGLVEELLRLEDAKHKALVSIDASAYDANVRKQMRLLSSSKSVQTSSPADVDRLLALSQLITLNTRLLQNLVSTTPWFALSEKSYTAKGNVTANTKRKVSLEA
jgi:hypothetical protein